MLKGVNRLRASVCLTGALAGAFRVLAFATQIGTEPVPPSFRYSKSPQTQILAKPQNVRSLKGKVFGPSGVAVAGPVLVEIVGSLGSDTRLDARFADHEGNFDFGKRNNGRYFLKISMAGFDTIYLSITLRASGKADLRVELRPST